MPTLEVQRAVEAIWRIESERVVARVARIVRDVGLAEALAEDALVAVLAEWPAPGSRTSQAHGSWRPASTGQSTSRGADGVDRIHG